MKSQSSLHDRVALITGGSEGMGRAIALSFAEAGADVAICARHLPKLKTVAERIRTLGRRSLAIQADIGSSDEVNAMMKATVKEFGGIDILVNVAFTMIASHPLMEYREKEWDNILDTNLKGYYLCC